MGEQLFFSRLTVRAARLKRVTAFYKKVLFCSGPGVAFAAVDRRTQIPVSLVKDQTALSLLLKWKSRAAVYDLEGNIHQKKLPNSHIQYGIIL